MRPRAPVEIVGADHHPEVVDHRDLGVHVDGCSLCVLEVVHRDSLAARSAEYVDHTLTSDVRHGTRRAAIAVGEAWYDRNDAQRGMASKGGRKRASSVERPEVLVLQVHETSGLRKRFEVGASDAPLAVGSERVPRALGGVRAKDLNGVCPSWHGWNPGFEWEGAAPAWLPDGSAERAAPGVSMVERRRILPPFAETQLEIVDRRSADLELQIVPGGTGPVGLGNVDRLRVASVVRVVVTPVAQVDPSFEGDRAVKPVGVADDHELLVVASAATDSLVEQYLAAGAVDFSRKRDIVLLREVRLPRMRSPEQPTHVDASSGEVSEHGADF